MRGAMKIRIATPALPKAPTAGQDHHVCDSSGRRRKAWTISSLNRQEKAQLVGI